MDFQCAGHTLHLRECEQVYMPHEDTQLLADVAAKRCAGSVLEIGCGSGAASVAVAKARHTQSFAGDINPHAVRCARENAKANGVRLEVRETDLFSAFKDERFDWVLFNPPYLPTTKAQKMDGPINHAFDGGESGLDVALAFVRQVPAHLRAGGRVLMICSTEQDLPRFNQAIHEAGLDFEVVAEEGFFFERLYAYEMRLARTAAREKVKDGQGIRTES